jgi:hypothetical protein
MPLALLLTLLALRPMRLERLLKALPMLLLPLLPVLPTWLRVPLLMRPTPLAPPLRAPVKPCRTLARRCRSLN